MRYFAVGSLALLLQLGHVAGWAQTETEPPAVSLTEAALRGAAVASALDMPRETPAQELQVVFTLLDLGHADVAQELWKDFAGEALDDNEKAALVKQFGVARFLKLARRASSDQLDGGRAFAESCLKAAAEVNRDPARLAELIAKLQEESLEVRQAARSDLAVTGDAGAVACLEALAAAENEQLRAELMLTLVQMRPGVEPMLITALAEGRGQFRRDVAELAGYMHLQDAKPWLAVIAAGGEADPTVVSAAGVALGKMGHAVPNSATVRTFVLNEIRDLESRQLPPADEGVWWSFDTEQNRLTGRNLTSREIQLLSIARLARALGQLPTATPDDQRLEWIYAYQVAQLLEQPLPAAMQQRADGLEVAELNQMLHEALEGNQITAAIACAELLGNRGDASALTSLDGLRSPLAAALVHSNRELRYAALEAVIKLRPQQSFAGASGVGKALWSFAAGAGTPQAIAASSVAARANDWAGQLRTLGYEATPVATGRDALRTALGSPRLELILVDSDIGRPLLREVIFQLRSTGQTARTPIAVLSSLPNLPRAEQIAEQDAWLIATPRPHGNEAMQLVLEQIAELDPTRANAERRVAQAQAALGWLADLLEAGHPYDELLRGASLIRETLYEAELTEASLRVLSVLGTAESQQLLLDVVSNAALPIETRQAAGKAFHISTERYGKLLTSEQILRQYDRYNASETADRATQEVLGEVLDAIEE